MTDTIQAPSLRIGVRTERNLVAWGILLVGVVALQVAFANSKVFPAIFDTTLSEPIDAFEGWARANRRTHPLFTGFLQPITSAVNFALTSFEDALLWLPWFVLPVAIFLIIARNGHWRMALVAGLAMVYPGLVGLWKPTIETLALMATAVLIAVLI